MWRISRFAFGELLEDSSDATSFYCFWCPRLRALIKGRSLMFVFIYLLEIFETTC